MVVGATLVDRKRVTLDVQVRTAAEPDNIRAADCLVLDEEEDQLILGKDVSALLVSTLEP